MNPGRTVIPANTLPLHLILPILLLALAPTAHALTPGEVFEAVKDSVVVVKSLDSKGKEAGMGSGVMLPSGKVGTNCHVVEGGASFQVGRKTTFLPATLDAGDRDKDICLLDTPGLKGRAAQLGKAAKLKVGEAVYAVGAPQGLELSLSNGIVSQLRGDKAPLIQTTAAISPGSSGGGLFDAQARLVGFTTLYIEGAQSLNFAVPVEWIADIKPGSKPVAKERGTTDWSTRAIELEQHKDWNSLRDWSLEWAKAEPENDEAWYNLGIAYDLLAYGHHNLPDDAIEAYREALRINPKFADAWRRLGYVYSRHLKRYDDAIKAFRQALRINREDADAWDGLGGAYAKLERYDDTIECFRQVLRINPEDSLGWARLAAIYARSGNKPAALDALKALRRINPAMADGMAYLTFEMGVPP
jgi:Tfp pilus assembly protein PilF